MEEAKKRRSTSTANRVEEASSPPKGSSSPGPLINSMEEFWPKQREKIRQMSAASFRDSTRHQELPLARIKKIMKIEEDVKNQMISAESPVLLAKAAELLIEELTLRAWLYTQESKRKTIQKSDIAVAASKNEMFDFLIDIVPRETRQSNDEISATDFLVDVPNNNTELGANQQLQQQPLHYVLQYGGDVQDQPTAAVASSSSSSNALLQLERGQIIQLSQATQIGQPIQLMTTGGVGVARDGHQFQLALDNQLVPLNSFDITTDSLQYQYSRE